MPEQHVDNGRKARQARNLRATLLGLGLLNTILIPCSIGSLFYGLIPTELSVAMNFLILLAPQTTGFSIIAFISDVLFSLGFGVWFIFANILMGSSHFHHFRQGNVVIGTWSTFVTLAMFFINVLLVPKTAKHLRVPRRQKQVKCIHCPHCQVIDHPPEYSDEPAQEDGKIVLTDEAPIPARDEEEGF